MENKIFIISGPTASGKSNLALELAYDQNAEIVNFDSLQVYKDLSILTARPPQSNIPHHLYGFLYWDQRCDAGFWVTKAYEIIETILPQRPLIFVGGTGLYIHALIKGLAPIPKVDPEIREFLHTVLKEKGSEEFYAWACEQDPLIEQKCHLHDQQRILRALEVLLGTGQSIYEWHEARSPLPYPFISIVLDPERENLYHTINQRVLKMIEEGAIEEVKRLIEQKVPVTASIYQTLGAKQLYSYLQGDISLETAIVETQIKTRQYAKRQMTWFRHQIERHVVLRELNFEVLKAELSKWG